MALVSPGSVEFNLDYCSFDFSEGDGNFWILVCLTRHGQDGTLVSRRNNSAHKRFALGDPHPHQSIDIAAPVARPRQRSVNAWATNLQGVSLFAHDIGVVQDSRHRSGDASHIIEGHSRLGIDKYPNQSTSTGGLDVDAFEVHAAFSHGRSDQGTHTRAQGFRHICSSLVSSPG